MSYLTAPTCLALGETLIELARVEQQIEVIRKLLCEQPRFHPYKGFKAIVSHKVPSHSSSLGRDPADRLEEFPGCQRFRG
jgi:hypothetical protein